MPGHAIAPASRTAPAALSGPADAVEPAALRSPDFVMSPRRAAASVPNALSFPRATMRDVVRDRYRIEKLRFELDAQGRGEVLYRIAGAGWTFHFFLISDLLPEKAKTDRNFAQSWDAMGVLCQGEWTAAREALLRREVPRQRAGFADYDTLMYARGNRSGRVFDHVVDSLAAGRQPDPRILAPVGYILRTTAFIGNGQLGTRPLAGFEPGHPLRRPYHAQFFSAFVLREYVFDLVDHMARARNAAAVRLAPSMRRYIGLGNSAATGLAAFAANHPHFMHQWNWAVEHALAVAKARPVRPGDAAVANFAGLLDKARRYYREGEKDGDGVFPPPQDLAADLARLDGPLEEFRSRGTIAGRATRTPWLALCDWSSRHLGAEACEVTHALVLELYPDIIDEHAGCFEADERFEIDPAMSAAQLRSLVERDDAWALALPADAAAAPYFWYRSSAAARDVRRGLRGRAPEYEAETAMDTVLLVRRLHDHLRTLPPELTVARMLCERPDLRHVVARVQSLAGRCYAEIRHQWLAEDFSPFASIRLPLTFYGMEKFEAAYPKSVRGTFMQGAPIAEDVARGRDGDWPFPLMPRDEAAGMDELAPLPASTAPDPGRLAAPPASPDDLLRIAPAELARMAQVALQGHGVPLGVAEDAAGLVAFAQACGEPAVDALLDALAGASIAPAAVRRIRLAQMPSAERPWHCIEAEGAAALACAPQAHDLALAQALACGVGLAAVRGSPGAELLKELVLRAARHGLVGLLSWHGAGTSCAAGGDALACPDASCARFAWRPRRAASRLYRQLLGGADAVAFLTDMADRGRQAEAIAAALAPASDPLVSGPGFVLAYLRPADAGIPGLVFDAAAGGWAVDRRGEELQRLRGQWPRRGVALTRREFDALARAGGALLVPKEEEHRLLPEGADPLRTF